MVARGIKKQPFKFKFSPNSSFVSLFWQVNMNDDDDDDDDITTTNAAAAA